ncbi:MAG TPA: hypothetical protein VN926_16870 [Bradyrhizobium sp.]|nr:hypothetical protein [Bradyrhizobium sp.]
MVVVQVRSQMVSNYNFASHSRFEKALLHVARQVRPQCEHGLAQQAFEFVSRVIHHRQTSLLKKAVEARASNVIAAETGKHWRTTVSRRDPFAGEQTLDEPRVLAH